MLRVVSLTPCRFTSLLHSHVSCKCRIPQTVPGGSDRTPPNVMPLWDLSTQGQPNALWFFPSFELVVQPDIKTNNLSRLPTAWTENLAVLHAVFLFPSLQAGWWRRASTALLAIRDDIQTLLLSVSSFVVCAWIVLPEPVSILESTFADFRPKVARLRRLSCFSRSAMRTNNSLMSL